MNSITKLRGWIFSIVLLASLISYAGYTHNSAVPQSFTSELAVFNNLESNSSAFYFYALNVLQTKQCSALLKFNFNYFLSAYNQMCNVKFEAQKTIAFNSPNHISIHELKLINSVNTDEDKDIFIG